MKQLPDALKQTLLFGVSIALMKGVSLIMLPFIAHYLSPNDFGRLEVISTLAVLGSILVGMGLEDTLFRFVGAEIKSHKRKQIAAEIFSLAIIIGVLSAVVFVLFSDRIAQLIPSGASVYQVKIVLFMIALEGIIAIPLGWLRMRNKAGLFFISTTGRAILQALLVILFLNLGRGVNGVLEAGLLSAIIQAFILAVLHFKNTGFHFSQARANQSLIYSLPIVASGFVAFALNGFDRWVLADSVQLVDVAHYGVASKFALAVVLLLQPFGMWWSPRRFSVLNEANGKVLVTKYISLGIVLALIIAVLVTLVAPLLIDWLMPKSYAEASQYIWGLVLIMLIREITELVNIGCFIGKTTLLQFWINLFAALIGLAAMYLFTPLYAVWGLIYALILAQSIRLLLFFRASQQALKLTYFERPLLYFIAICSLMVVLALTIDDQLLQVLLVLVITSLLFLSALKLKLIPQIDALAKW